MSGGNTVFDLAISGSGILSSGGIIEASNVAGVTCFAWLLTEPVEDRNRRIGLGKGDQRDGWSGKDFCRVVADLLSATLTAIVAAS